MGDALGYCALRMVVSAGKPLFNAASHLHGLPPPGGEGSSPRDAGLGRSQMEASGTNASHLLPRRDGCSQGPAASGGLSVLCSQTGGR